MGWLLRLGREQMRDTLRAVERRSRRNDMLTERVQGRITEMVNLADGAR